MYKRQDRYWLASVQTLGELGLELGREDYCRLTIERLTPYRGRVCIVGLCAAIGTLVDTALGQAWLGLGNAERAEGFFRDALDQAERIRAPHFAVVARRFLARTLATRGLEADAVTMLHTVLSDTRRFGFTREEATTASMLDQLRASAVDGEPEPNVI